MSDRPWFGIALRSMPPNKEVAELRLPDGTEILGWRVYDSVLGRSRYWRWSEEAPPPSDQSAWARNGVQEVIPVDWRPYVRPKVGVDQDAIARREAETILMRTIRADGFKRNAARGDVQGFKSSLDVDAAWSEEYSRYAANEKWRPEGFDWDNYLIAMRWYVELTADEKKVVRWRCVGRSFWWIGDMLRGVSGERARKIYNSAIDKIWSFAARDQAAIRRLSPALWDHKGRHT
jgi:hypothetical protein